MYRRVGFACCVRLSGDKGPGMAVNTTELEQRGQVVVVRVGLSEVDHGQMQEIASECAQRMRFDNAQHFVFDMEGVTFLASACIGVLVELLQDLENMRGRIMLANCSENVLFLFRVTKLDSVFMIFEEVEEAMDELVR